MASFYEFCGSVVLSYLKVRRSNGSDSVVEIVYGHVAGSAVCVEAGSWADFGTSLMRSSRGLRATNPAEDVLDRDGTSLRDLTQIMLVPLHLFFFFWPVCSI